ncbi:unnamed protein product, partial [Staurois parvus]
CPIVDISLYFMFHSQNRKNGNPSKVSKLLVITRATKTSFPLEDFPSIAVLVTTKKN